MRLQRRDWTLLLVSLLGGCSFDTSGPHHLRSDGAISDSITVSDAVVEVTQLLDHGVDGLREQGMGLDGALDGGPDATPDQSPPPLPTSHLVFGTDDPETMLRVWNGATTSWLADPAPPLIGLDLRWARTRPHPEGQVLVLKGFAQGDEQTQVWQRSIAGWAEVTTLRQEPQDDGLWQTRDVALGREALSGDLLLVVGARAKAPRYATFSAGQWSALQRLPTEVKDDGVVAWVELVQRRGSNELMLLYSDAGADLHGVRWDGSAWDVLSFEELTNDLNKNDDNGLVSNRAFDGAYEGDSGEFLAVWGREAKNGIQHATWDGTSWVQSGDNEFYTGRSYFVDLAADPRAGSNLIAATFVDMGGGTERLAAGTWDGAQWVGLAEYDAQIYDYNDEGWGDAPSAVGWADGTAVCLYPEEDGALKWLSWEEGGGGDWTVHEELHVADMGQLESVLMASQESPSSGVVAVLSDDEQQLFSIFYDGQSWQRLGFQPLSSSLSSDESTPFDLCLQ